jgi:hypothetical protein
MNESKDEIIKLRDEIERLKKTVSQKEKELVEMRENSMISFASWRKIGDFRIAEEGLFTAWKRAIIGTVTLRLQYIHPGIKHSIRQREGLSYVPQTSELTPDEIRRANDFIKETAPIFEKYVKMSINNG